MNHSTLTQPNAVEAAALEARFGLRIAAQLDSGARELPHDIQERLRVAREGAVARARHQRRLAAVTTPVGTGRGAALALGGPSEPWWLQLSALAPMLLLLAGLLFIQDWQHSEQIDAAAEIDAEILSDSLPPQAYADPAFSEFLQLPLSPARPDTLDAISAQE